ncbi:unnamed protein product [Phytophthora lilii]|uniref:Unnamed protein product n=1 Tax=Phytophthora lilii TaxID=2077276 RepID=A0A9W6U3H4_9STRA|nr:unnamed protein product [Phytophthora lilii]
MQHKMEVLTRPAGAIAGPPRVISDASMTMSFSLPASYLQARAAQSAASAVKQEKSVKNVENAAEDSWEARDWEQDAPAAVENAAAESDADDWEQEATPELPDDFPRLIVNLTRVQRDHFPAATEDGDFDTMEVFHRVKNTLQQHFSQLAEVLFEQSQ